MSRKIILSLAAATIAVAALASQSAEARGFGGGLGGGLGGARFVGGTHLGGGTRLGGGVRLATTHFRGSGGGHPILDPGPRIPRRPWPPIRLGWHDHHHKHWVFRGGRWIDVDGEVDDVTTTAPAADPGPCTCLTKNYTPDGLVVFADVCTKESASASVNGNAADATQTPTTQTTPTDYAGRTYQDYLAANPQAAQSAPSKN